MEGKHHPYQNCPSNPLAQGKNSWLKKLFMTWLYPVVSKCSKDTLGNEDIYKTEEKLDAQLLGDKLEKIWDLEIEESASKKMGPSLAKSLVVFGKRELIVSLVLLGLSELLFKNVTVFMIPKIIEVYGQSNYLSAHLHLLALIACYVASAGVETYALNIIGYYSVKVIAGMMTLIDRVILRTTKQALDNFGDNAIMNYIGSDVMKLKVCLKLFMYSLISPFKIVVYLITFWVYIGPSCLFIIGTIVLSVFVQAILLNKMFFNENNAMLLSDQRIQFIVEGLVEYKTVKLLGLEHVIIDKIVETRNKELKEYIHINHYKSLINAALGTVQIVSFFLFAIYLDMGKAFSVGKFYLLLSIILQSKTAVMSIAMGFGEIVGVLVSIERIQNFLLEADTTRPNYTAKPDSPTSFVNVSNLTLAHRQLQVVKDVNFELKSGEFLAIVGVTGSGKTMIIKAILGELLPVTGDISISGSIAYVPQTSWIFKGTIQENILFGRPMVAKTYEKILDICCLVKDLNNLPKGDKTPLTVGGPTLSGGQRVKVNLARALYTDADIYLLDDILSAFDAEVGKCIFQKCICEYLNDKVVILITHQLNYKKTGGTTLELDSHVASSTQKADEIDGLRGLPPSLGLPTSLPPDEIYNEDNKLLRRISLLDPSLLKVDELTPLVVKTPPKSIFTIMGSFFKQSGIAWAWLFLPLAIAFYVLVEAGCEMMISAWIRVVNQGMKNEIDDPFAVPRMTTWNAIMNVSFMFVLFLFYELIGYLVNFSLTSINNKMTNKVFRTSMKQFKQYIPGEIITSFSEDLNQVDKIAISTLAMCFMCLSPVVTAVAVSLAISWKSVIGLLLWLIVGVLLASFIIPAVAETNRLVSEATGHQLDHLKNVYDGLSLIHIAGKANVIHGEMHDYINMVSSALYTNTMIGNWLFLLVQMMSQIICYLILVTVLVTEKGTQKAYVGLLLSNMTIVGQSLFLVFNGMIALSINLTHVQRLLRYSTLEEEQKPDKGDGPPEKRKPTDDDKKMLLDASLQYSYEKLNLEEVTPSWPQNPAISFDQVFLYYGKKDEPSLKNFTLDIKAGEMIGIVGRTGSGKTTIMNSMCRLYDADGAIYIDDRNIFEMDLTLLRDSISVVTQAPFLFTGTIRENLDPLNRYADEEIWSVLNKVRLNEVIAECPFGLSSMIGKTGTDFSLGQRQLLCLARIILKNNKILFLDEPTANIDLETDRLIQMQIREMAQGKTVLIIAHRLETVMDCSRVIVMDLGECKEFDEPYILLQNPDSHLYRLAQKSGGDSMTTLMDQAKEAYDKYHGNSL